jgi:hypothetical protein
VYTTTPHNRADSRTETDKNEMPKFGSAEVQKMADKAIVRTKDNFKNAQATAAEAGHAFESAYTIAAQGTTDYNLKLFEIARFNTNSAFDYARDLLAVRTPPGFLDLSTARVRQQFETIKAQTKELATLAQKVSAETAKPLKISFNGAFNKVTELTA